MSDVYWMQNWQEILKKANSNVIGWLYTIPRSQSGRFFSKTEFHSICLYCSEHWTVTICILLKNKLNLGHPRQKDKKAFGFVSGWDASWKGCQMPPTSCLVTKGAAVFCQIFTSWGSPGLTHFISLMAGYVLKSPWSRWEVLTAVQAVDLSKHISRAWRRCDTRGWYNTHNASDIPIETVRVGICIFEEEHYSRRL